MLRVKNIHGEILGSKSNLQNLKCVLFFRIKHYFLSDYFQIVIQHTKHMVLEKFFWAQS